VTLPLIVPALVSVSGPGADRRAACAARDHPAGLLTSEIVPPLSTVPVPCW
jgi:hypothetical protein